MADPCGVPQSRCSRVPSARCIGAFSHRFTYSTTHFRSVFATTALTIRSCGTLSKNPAMSQSNTHECVKQRARHAATASNADRPGRYPYEPGWNLRSTTFSNSLATTVWATLFATVGTPNILTPPPCGFGTATAFTGGGK